MTRPRSRTRSFMSVVAVAAAVLAAQTVLAPAAQAFPSVERYGGADRYTVSALVSEKTFATGVDVAYIASGVGFADALSASAAAGIQNAPVLLVPSSGIPDAVAAELIRLAPSRIVVAGGPASIDDETLHDLRNYSLIVDRLDGANRYEVSALLSSDVFRPGRSVVYVASGAVFPDALSGSAAAGSLLAPVLLTAKDAIPAVVLAELSRLQPGKIVLMGGESTVSPEVARQLGEIAPVTRTSGADRYEVSAATAAGFRTDIETVYVASGLVFPDALSGSAAAIVNDAPVVLVRPDSIPGTVAAELGRLRPKHIIVLGGPTTIGDPVLTELQQYIGVSK
ncbi:cell wall-binding repeat-containing protein [Herbiconiux sp. CPCC 203407]|uniref:Cell wall-binding repeat-containing protein n=1 Tax=Herbiconiux oxytropis TaxID=2970915 RepID=A0AA42BSS2_9MICO|nr:cell wall-binding repeat-containing protein [Herbiconiux oxytropis]MCS5720999.1 cell wall-binding repeat-containing protein [Herbiconiux oxytropis]MCS5724476.1 cell wall-binding repeat-containing protein [Herbiconiux oxytropis]